MFTNNIALDHQKLLIQLNGLQLYCLQYEEFVNAYANDNDKM